MALAARQEAIPIRTFSIGFEEAEFDELPYARDVARLVGSLVANDRSEWGKAIEAYRQVAPFSDRDFDWALRLDASSVVVAGLNWINWLFVESRHLENAEVVSRRVHELALRLQPRLHFLP